MTIEELESEVYKSEKLRDFFELRPNIKRVHFEAAIKSLDTLESEGEKKKLVDKFKSDFEINI